MTRSLVAIMSIAFLCCTIHAQTPDTVTVHGVVTDSSHSIVVGAGIKIMNESTGLVRAGTSGSMGRFTIGGLPIGGAYTIRVAKDGFADAEAAHVQFIPGSSAIISFTLSAVGKPSFVTVKGTLTGLRVDQPQLGINLSREQIEATPLLNRRITGLPC
jgi:hypothetical protein